MRIWLAIAAFFIWIPIVSAGQVVNGVTYNFTGTDWSSTDCNGKKTAAQCTLNGAGTGDGVAGDDGEGDH